MRTSLLSLGGIKLRRRPLWRRPELRDLVHPETLRQFAGKWIAWASSDRENYEIVASTHELGDVLNQVFQLGLRYGVTYQRLPDPDDRPVG